VIVSSTSSNSACISTSSIVRHNQKSSFNLLLWPYKASLWPDPILQAPVHINSGLSLVVVQERWHKFCSRPPVYIFSVNASACYLPYDRSRTLQTSLIIRRLSSKMTLSHLFPHFHYSNLRTDDPKVKNPQPKSGHWWNLKFIQRFLLFSRRHHEMIFFLISKSQDLVSQG